MNKIEEILEEYERVSYHEKLHGSACNYDGKKMCVCGMQNIRAIVHKAYWEGKSLIEEAVKEIEGERKEVIRDEEKQGFNLARRIEGYNQALDRAIEILKSKI
jgi:hypothetical protein